MDLAREDLKRVGAKEGDEIDRVKWKILFCALATPNREKPKDEEEEGGIETQLKMIVTAKWWLFSQLHKYIN